MEITEQPVKVHRFENMSRTGRMLYIGFYTLILNILTLTLFRFWGRTHFRRQLWSDTKIDGQPIEYTGRGKEIFIGFLLAICVFVLAVIVMIAFMFVIAPVFAAIMTSIAGGSVILFSFFSLFVSCIAGTIMVFWLLGIATFLARRYLVSRTRYRGIRFVQKGSVLEYGIQTLICHLLVVITLGWYAPMARIRLSRYMWSNTFFGGENIRFNDTQAARKEPVYKSFALLWSGTIVLYTSCFSIVYSNVITAGMNGGDLPSMISFYALVLVFSFVHVLFTAWHSVVMTRRIVKSLSFAGAVAVCDLKTMELMKVWFVGVILNIATLGIGSMAVRMMNWRIIANHTRLEGEIDFDAIAQASSTAPSQGEGLAEGFGIADNLGGLGTGF